MNNKLHRMSIVVAGAALIGLVAVPAQAETVETRGGIRITSDDGRFKAQLGGRIHLDSNVWVDDDEFGDLETGVFFRRGRITLEGEAYGWRYKFENDFAGQSGDNGSGIREMWIGTTLAGVKLRLGQAKPYRGIEELTSSNDLLFMERPFASGSGIYRQYQTGVFADAAGSNYGWGAAVYNLRNGADSDDDTDGVGATVRGYYLPIMDDDVLLHVGGIASLDNPANGKTVGASVRFAGRRGPSQGLGSTTEDQQSFGVELAGRVGSLSLQSEYHFVTLAQPSGDDTDLSASYVQVSWLLNGEVKPYDVGKGAFKSPKPAGGRGAWELKLRYDLIDVSGRDPEIDVSQLAAGANWYVNPNVRFMLEYIQGESDLSDGTGVDGSLIAARAQLSF